MTIAGSPKLERMAQDADTKRREALNEKIERLRTLAKLALAEGNIPLATDCNRLIKQLRALDLVPS